MGVSASVKVLAAEVRVVQVDGRQLTRSMCWQLDKAAIRRLEPFGRVKDKQAGSDERSAAGRP
jgi:hypothetical protein